MLALCGYNFLRDKNALDASPLGDEEYTVASVSNGIYDNFTVTRDVNSPYTSAIPTEWDMYTILNANFNGNLNAGNTDFVIDSIDGLKLKRRKTDEFNWITLRYFPKSELSSLSIAFNDYLAQSETEYEYAIIPVIGGEEGNYITNQIKSKFNGVFICDADTIYKFASGVKYGTEQQIQKVAVFEPYGRKYPVFISNGLLNYASGNVTGYVLPPNYMESRDLGKVETVKERKALLEFLTNKKAKILKDWQSNIWLIIVSDSPSTAFEQNSSLRLASVSMNWREAGDANNQTDLYNSGLVKERL